MLLFSRVIRLFSMLAMAFVLASCGGGGTGSPLDNNSGGGDPTDPGDDSSVLSGSVQMTMEDESNPGVEITSISSTSPGLLLITLLDDDGDPVANEIVQLEVVLGAGDLSASTALTNASGVASVNVNVATGDSPGAGGRVRAWYEANSGDTVEGFYNYEVVNSGTTSTAGFSVAIELFEVGVDISTGTPAGAITNTVSSANPGTLVIIVTDTITDNPISNAIVEVSTDVGILVPDSGRVLTNANGIATVTVTSDDTAAAGAGTLVATVDDVVATRNFSVGSVPLQLGRDNNGYTDVINNLDFEEGFITVTNANISSNGSTSLFVVVADENGDVYSPPLTVNFTSSCALQGNASLDTGIITSNGVAVSSYEATGCSGPDDITATIEGVSGASATGTVTITDSIANSIRFVGADPESIAIKGTGGSGRQENSTLTFQVVDENGAAKTGVSVSFALSTTTGGVSLAGDLNDDGVMDGAESKSTNPSGNVTVTVNAGTAVTPVRVTASFIDDSGETISVVSDALTISTGLPDQNSFSLSAAVLNPGGWDQNNIITGITILAGDAFENPVPDGTVINFTTEYGRISNPEVSPPTASCQTVNGECTVQWNSQSPRMPNFASTGTPLVLGTHACPSADGGAVSVPCTSFLTSPLPDTTDGQIFGGRSTVLAFAPGEESFIDANGNGFYDYNDANSNGTYDIGEELEPFTDLPEAYIDHNDDGVFGSAYTDGGCISDTGGICGGWQEGGAEEEHIDIGQVPNGDYDAGNGIYNGSLCSPELKGLDLCSSELITVRDQLELVVGGSTAYVAFYDGTGDYLDPALGEVNVDVTGPGNLTRVVAIADRFNGYLPAGTTITVASNNCKVFGITEYEIANTNAYGIFTFSLSFAEDTTTDNSSDTIDIQITPPDGVGGAVVNTSFLCSDAD